MEPKIEFWKKWEDLMTDETKQREHVASLLPVFIIRRPYKISSKQQDEINSSLLNSYFQDLYEYLQDEHAKLCDIKER